MAKKRCLFVTLKWLKENADPLTNRLRNGTLTTAEGVADVLYVIQEEEKERRLQERQTKEEFRIPNEFILEYKLETRKKRDERKPTMDYSATLKSLRGILYLEEDGEEPHKPNKPLINHPAIEFREADLRGTSLSSRDFREPDSLLSFYEKIKPIENYSGRRSKNPILIKNDLKKVLGTITIKKQ